MAKKRITVQAVGISPILMNAIPDDLLENLIRKITPPKEQGADVDLDQLAERKLYRDDGGVIGIPSQNLFAAMKYAGRFVKDGKKNVSTAKTTALPEMVELEHMFIPLNGGRPGTQPVWKRDMRRGVHHQGAAQVMVALVRPRFDAWGFATTLLFDDNNTSEKLLRQVIEVAGSKSGLCDFRPSTGGPFGRFTISDWVVEVVAKDVKERTAVAA